MIQTAIHSILEADSGVTALTTNISHGLMNQETNMPFITFLVYDVEPNETKDDVSRLDEVYLSVSAVSKDNLNALNIGAAIRTALDDYSGTIDGETIQRISFLKHRDAWINTSKAFQVTMEFQIFLER